MFGYVWHTGNKTYIDVLITEQLWNLLPSIQPKLISLWFFKYLHRYVYSFYETENDWFIKTVLIIMTISLLCSGYITLGGCNIYSC